jgi:hypothetical protein
MREQATDIVVRAPISDDITVVLPSDIARSPHEKFTQLG